MLETIIPYAIVQTVFSVTFVNSMLDDFGEEIHKVPTREEYLWFLDGELSAIGHFVPDIGGTYEQVFHQLLDDFAAYKMQPDLSHAQTIEQKIDFFKTQTASYVPLHQGMRVALDDLYAQLNQDFESMTAQSKEYLKGTQWLLYSISNFDSQFDTEYDQFDDEFQIFMASPSREKQEELSRTIRHLQDLLNYA
jgi:hypothetical protein